MVYCPGIVRIQKDLDSRAKAPIREVFDRTQVVFCVPDERLCHERMCGCRGSVVCTGTHGILAFFCAARMRHAELMVNESRRPSGRCGDAWLTRSHKMARSRLSARSLKGRSSTCTTWASCVMVPES